MERNVLFSVVIPTYNRAGFIKSTVEGFMNQTYTNFEVIIVDDGSTDNTEEVAATITNERVKYFKKGNGERGAARNYGLMKATGDYVNFFDSDDLPYPNHLQTAFEAVTKFNRPEIFTLGHDLKTPEGKVLAVYDSFDGNTADYAVKQKKISINAFFARTDVAKEIIFSENRLLSASEDALFVCQLCARYPLYYINTVTSTILEHDSRSMAVASEQQLLNRKKYLIEGLHADKVFMEKYGMYVADIEREMNYLLTLSCLINKENAEALNYFKAYLKDKPAYLLNFRTLVFIKKYLTNFSKA